MQTFQQGVPVWFAALAAGYGKDAEDVYKVFKFDIVFLSGVGPVVPEVEFRRYIQARLPEWISVDEWLEECWEVAVPTISSREVAASLGVSRKEAMSRLQAERAWYITRDTPRGEDLYASPLWSLSREVKNKPCTPYDVARLFAVDRCVASRWFSKGLIVCPLGHDHPRKERFLRNICWLAMLRKLGNAKVQPMIVRFWAERLIAGHPVVELWTAQRVAEAVGCSHQTVHRALEDGRLPGIRTFGNAWRIMPEWVEGFTARSWQRRY